ncbi:MAG: hypothetical protein QNI91_07050 [Arenicellales bacterium]|nr:hypothetical protein [Arenicellales bacterium]
MLKQNLYHVFTLLVGLGLFACSSIDNAEPKSELEQRAQSGDIDAEYQLGRQYAASGLSQEPQAIYWLCRAAKEGHVPAQLELAMFYAEDAKTGDNTKGDGSRLSTWGNAYFWYTAAASQGSEKALTGRDDVAANMDEGEIMEVKRKATRWQQAVCVKP